MPKPLIVYTYAKCSTCRSATDWLRAQGIGFEERPIYTQPPTRTELTRMLAFQGGELRKLFNTSGIEYRARGLKDKLGDMSTEEALKLLTSEGRLVKRPFLLTDKVGLLGFQAETWRSLLE
jgi:arsenate reductase